MTKLRTTKKGQALVIPAIPQIGHTAGAEQWGHLLVTVWIAVGLAGCGVFEREVEAPRASICPPMKREIGSQSNGSVALDDWNVLVPISALRQGEQARPQCPGRGRDGYYFPERTFYRLESISGRGGESGRTRRDVFVRRWYSSHLTTMLEAPIWCGKRRGNTYRLLWLGTWERPISVRIDASEGQAILSAVELSGAGGYTPGERSCGFRRELSDAEQLQFIASVEKSTFWTLPTIGGNLRGLDGTHWIIEGRSPNAYHVVDRWSPEEGAYLELGLLFLRLAGFRDTTTGGQGAD